MISGLIEGLMLAFLVICLIWGSYSLFLIFFGLTRKQKAENRPRNCTHRYKISLLIPVKNEEKVIGRLLESILKQTYPRKLVEVVIVEDGSTDKTEQVCRLYAKKYPRLIKFFHLNVSKGKPYALNFAARKASGEILGVIDGDMMLPPNLLEKINECFSDPRIQAIQGALYPINANQNLLTRLVAATDYFGNFMNLSKNCAGMFVGPSPCFFIRGEALRKVGFWRDVLTEDVDLGIRLLQNGIKVRFMPQIYGWQEEPPRWKNLFRQRIRWAQGMFQVLVLYRRFWLQPHREFFDAFMTLSSYIVGILAATGYFFFIVSFFIPLYVPTPLKFWAWAVTFLSMGTTCAAYLRMKVPGGIKNVPLMYAAYSLMSFINAYALVRFVLGKPIDWVKTEHEGWTDQSFANRF
jgi:cellulose synthase/poly-beta-1,6-N-acetylglucosamine synthase-like glycosyltransferase